MPIFRLLSPSCPRFTTSPINLSSQIHTNVHFAGSDCEEIVNSRDAFFTAQTICVPPSGVYVLSILSCNTQDNTSSSNLASSDGTTTLVQTQQKQLISHLLITTRKYVTQLGIGLWCANQDTRKFQQSGGNCVRLYKNNLLFKEDLALHSQGLPQSTNDRMQGKT